MIPYVILAIEDESDREYMTSLYIEYHRLMYSEIKKLLSDKEAIEDVLQSTLVKLIDKISLLRRFDRTHLVNYIIVSCRNTARNELRYRSRHPAFSFDETFDGSEPDSAFAPIEEQIAHADSLARLAQVWDKLDERSRYLLEARYILEKTDADIATDLGIQAKSVRMALTRARKTARLLMDET